MLTGQGMVSGFFALGSLCGIAALAWLIIQYRAQARGRLKVTSTRSLAGGIDVLVQYRPSRTRVGLKARLSLIEPAAARLVGGERQERNDRYGAYAAKMANEAVSGRAIESVLKHLQPDPPGVFACVFYVTGLDASPISAARVKVEIWTDAGPVRLVQRDVVVRAINW